MRVLGECRAALRQLDHAVLASQRDGLCTWDGIEPEGIVVIPGDNPTAENIASFCQDHVVNVVRARHPDRDITYHPETTIQEAERGVFSLASEVVI